MLKYIVGLSLFMGLASCMKAEKADLVVHNGTIYTVDDEGTVGEAMAIRDGEVIEVGPEREILNKYRADEFIDLQKRFVYPGLIDAHGHLHGLARQYLTPDLSQTKSPKECIDVLKKFYKDKDVSWITGRGWDQENWGLDSIPDNTFLNDAFPDIPVYITRVDGHAALVNNKAVEVSKVNVDSTLEGGTFIRRNEKFSGILVDLAMDPFKNKIPDFSNDQWKEALIQAQQHLLKNGITTIADAGSDHDNLLRFLELNENEKLIIDIYAMLFPLKKNYDWIKENGHYKEGQLTIRSIKVISDGAMGSNGACMLEPYHDVHQHGKMLKNKHELKDIAVLAKIWDYQLNVHCIGDSANRTVLNVMGSELHDMNDLRWRIEHAQILHPDELEAFKKYSIIPSVQPTHLMSDYRWLEKKLGKERMSRGYRYQSLLQANGIIAYGTDFPVEPVNPFRTFFASIQRTMENGIPEGGYLPEEKLSREETLKAMTNWAALSIFMEDRLGDLSAGKQADFIVLERDIMKIQPEDVLKSYVLQTYKKGKLEYDAL